MPGKFVQLTFTFQHAQQVTLDVPVMLLVEPRLLERPAAEVLQPGRAHDGRLGCSA